MRLYCRASSMSVGQLRCEIAEPAGVEGNGGATLEPVSCSGSCVTGIPPRAAVAQPRLVVIANVTALTSQ